MNKVNRNFLAATAAVTLLLGTVAVQAAQEHGGQGRPEGHAAAPAPAPAPHVEAHRPAPGFQRQNGGPAPGYHEPARPAVQPAQRQPAGAAPGAREPVRQAVPTRQGSPGGVQAREPARSFAQPSGGQPNGGQPNGGQRFAPQPGAQAGGQRFAPQPGQPNGGQRYAPRPGGPGAVARSPAQSYRGTLPGQFRGQRGQWRGLPPGPNLARRNWGGGAWRGRFWPRVNYGGYYPLYLSVLPAAYATYWFGSVPYYYANDVYYTWSAPDAGYVVTDPPPALSDDDLGAVEAAGGYDGGDAPPPDYADASQDGAYDEGAPPTAAQDYDQAPPADAAYPAAAPAYGGAPTVYAYPRNGQSPQQQAQDKAECSAWASQQSGYGANGAAPTAPAQDAYQRAVIACLEGRGYSAR